MGKNKITSAHMFIAVSHLDTALSLIEECLKIGVVPHTHVQTVQYLIEESVKIEGIPIFYLKRIKSSIEMLLTAMEQPNTRIDETQESQCILNKSIV